jgi:hypothetical protein
MERAWERDRRSWWRAEARVEVVEQLEQTLASDGWVALHLGQRQTSSLGQQSRGTQRNFRMAEARLSSPHLWSSRASPEMTQCLPLLEQP